MNRQNAIWVVAAAAGIGLAWLLRAPYVAFALYAFILLVAVANLTSRLWLAGLDCSRTVSRDTVRQGDQVDVEVVVANRRGWPIPWLYVEDPAPPGFTRIGDNARLAVLMPGRELHLTYRLTCPYRGYHRIGPLLMESGDLFGLQKRFRTGTRQDYVSVLPTVAYIETFTISARRPQGPVKVVNRLYEDPTRISGVREYTPGDPLSRIHWKLSARTGDLFVKQVEPSNVLGATLLLDLFGPWYAGENGRSRMELAVTTAASLAYLLQLSGEQVGMVTNAHDAAEVAKYEVAGTEALSRQESEARMRESLHSDRLSPLEVPTQRSPDQARRIIENLARVLPSDGLDLVTLLGAVHGRLPRDAALIAIVPKVTDDLALALGTMKHIGFAVTVVLIANTPNHPEAAGMLAQHEIGLVHIEHERHLHEIKLDRLGR